MTLTRADLVQQLIDEYKRDGKDAAVKLFRKFIKQYGMTQLGIRATILDFRERCAAEGLPTD